MNVDFGHVLAIGAHPDDVEFGTGGLLQLTTSPSILVLSRGEWGGPGETRQAEAEESARILKARLVVGGQRDREPDLRQSIAIVERELTVRHHDTVLVPHGQDTHQDHRACFRAAMSAVRRWSGTVLAYVSPSSLHFDPNFFVRLDEQAFAKKVESVMAHQSQLHHPHLTPERLAAMASYWGMMSGGVGYAEPFVLIRHAELSAER
jgi:LmbE family N-acetylglucosaminyl deacetylase